VGVKWFSPEPELPLVEGQDEDLAAATFGSSLSPSLGSTTCLKASQIKPIFGFLSIFFF